MSAVGPIGRYGTEAMEGLRDVRGREMARREWERDTGRDGAGGFEGGRESVMQLCWMLAPTTSPQRRSESAASMRGCGCG